MTVVVTDIFDTIASSEDDIISYIEDYLYCESQDVEGDLRKLERHFDLLENEYIQAEKRKFKDGTRERNKLSGGRPSKISKANDYADW